MKTYRKSRNSMFLTGNCAITLVAALMLMLVVIRQPAHATIQVIDFEDLYPGYETHEPLPPGYAGFNWSSDAWWVTSQDIPGSGYEFGTIGHVSMYTAYESNISMGGAQFQLSGAFVTSAWNLSQDFTIEGWVGGSPVYSHNFTTAYDGPYWFDFSQQVVDTVWFIPGPEGPNAGLGGHGAHLVIDNINVVPEPATVALLGLGSLSLLRRRKK